MRPNELQLRLRELSEAIGRPSPALEARLRQGYRARRRNLWRPAWAVAAALAAGIGMGVWLSSKDEAAPPPREAFLLLDHGRPTAELTPGRLLRVTLPPTAPAWFGLPVDPAARRGVEAEVLLSDDGVAQAVRFIE